MNYKDYKETLQTFLFALLLASISIFFMLAMYKIINPMLQEKNDCKNEPYTGTLKSAEVFIPVSTQ